MGNILLILRRDGTELERVIRGGWVIMSGERCASGRGRHGIRQEMLHSLSSDTFILISLDRASTFYLLSTIT